MRTLPLANFAWPRFRVVIRKRFQDSSTASVNSGSSWTVLPELRAPVKGNRAGSGTRVLKIDRVALPAVGTATFAFNYGKIDDKLINVDPESALRQAGGKAWDPTVDGTAAPSLTGYEIRIQITAGGGATPAWYTCFWGECLYEKDNGWPGSKLPAGERVYYCVDGLYRTQRWRLDRHGYAMSYATGGYHITGRVRGHPGYNVQHGKDARILGNRLDPGAPWISDGGAPCDFHTFPSQFDASTAGTWTDQQAIEHALAASRPQGEPLFKISDQGTLAQGVNAWPVHDGDTVFELLAKMFKRDRGRGLAYLTWDFDGGAPTGPLHPYIIVKNQNAFDVSWSDPVAGADFTIPKSAYNTDNNALTVVDLIGDHRVIAEAFEVGGKDQFRLDALETQGEPIEVLTSLAYRDGLGGTAPNQDGTEIQRAWRQAEQATFRGLSDPLKRVDERWRPVYQYHRIPLNWDGTVGDGENGVLSGSSRCDYRCAYDGTIIAPGQSKPDTDDPDQENYTQAISPLLLEIQATLPLYDGYTYAGATPAMWDGSTVETADRRPPMAFLRVGKNAYVHMHEKGKSVMMEVRPNLIALYEAGDEGAGTRYFSDTTFNPSGVSYTDLLFTVSLKLPNHVRFYSGEAAGSVLCKRRGTISYPGLHLWLAHYNAIWDLDATTGSATSGHTPKRNACKGSIAKPGILRDDRSTLAKLHAIAWSWYGKTRQTLKYAFRDCGLLPHYLAFSGSKIPTDGSDPLPYQYPNLGDIIGTCQANGETHDINTPVTRISYDNEQGVTRFETDWAGLDFVQ